MLLSQLSCKYWHSSLAMIALPQERDFIGEMTKLVEDLADPKASSPNSKMYVFFLSIIYNRAFSFTKRISLSNVTKVAGVVSTVAGIAVGAANPVAFITLPVIASVVIAIWVYEVYQAT